MISTHTPWLSIHTQFPIRSLFVVCIIYKMLYLCLFFFFFSLLSRPILVCKYTCHRTCEPKVYIHIDILDFDYFKFISGEKKFKTKTKKKSLFVFLMVLSRLRDEGKKKKKREKAHPWFTLGPVFNTALSY